MTEPKKSVCPKCDGPKMCGETICTSCWCKEQIKKQPRPITEDDVRRAQEWAKDKVGGPQQYVDFADLACLLEELLHPEPQKPDAQFRQEVDSVINDSKEYLRKLADEKDSGEKTEKFSICSIHREPKEDCKMCQDLHANSDGPPRIEPTEKNKERLYHSQNHGRLIGEINKILAEQHAKGRDG